MASPPPSDYGHIPDSHRAHLLRPPGGGRPADPPRRPRRRRLSSLLHKPLTYVVALLSMGIGAGIQQFLTDRTAGTLEGVFTDPLFAFEVEMLDPAPYHPSGHVVPGVFTDADFDGIDWDERFLGLPAPEWTVGQDGAFAGWGQWEVALEGTRDETVTVTDLYPTDVSCSEPLNGTYFPLELQGTGEKIGLGVDIDDPNARLKQLPLDASLSSEAPDLDALPVFSDTATITLDRGEKEVITFMAHADEQYCEFALAVEYLAEGRRQSARIAPDPPGRFSVTAVLDAAAYESMVLPWTICTDFQPHAAPGSRAAEILETLERTSAPVDCT